MSIQDLGRPGHSAMGVAAGGAADALSLRIGNRLVGNADGAAAIEMTMLGGTFVFDDAAVVCVIGGDAACSLDSHPVSSRAPLEVPIGSMLAIGPIARGVRTYLCISGGVDVPMVLGSRSTHLAAAFGGHCGRALAAGDCLALAASTPRPRSLPSALAPIAMTPERPILRVVPRGSFDGREFWSASHVVSNQSNRAGVRLHRLASPPLAPVSTGRMITEGMPHGAIQLPPGGEAIILGPDHPTTGGYPVIGCVAAVDLHRIGQLRPGEAVRFMPITPADALLLYRERERTLDRLLPPHFAQ